MLKRFFIINFLFFNASFNLISSQSACVFVRGSADYSLLLSLTESLPIEVHMMPKRQSGCACCQHGAPHTHMTVSKARDTKIKCVMPRLKQPTDIAQAIRMIKRWSLTLTRQFPEQAQIILGNQEKIIGVLTSLRSKWQDVDIAKSPSELDISFTLGGYVEALERWFESQGASLHVSRSAAAQSNARA